MSLADAPLTRDPIVSAAEDVRRAGLARPRRPWWTSPGRWA